MKSWRRCLLSGERSGAKALGQDQACQFFRDSKKATAAVGVWRRLTVVGGEAGEAGRGQITVASLQAMALLRNALWLKVRLEPCFEARGHS